MKEHDVNKLNQNIWPHANTATIRHIGERRASPESQYQARMNKATARYEQWVDLNQPVLKRTYLNAWNRILRDEGLAQAKHLPMPLPSLWRRLFGT